MANEVSLSARLQIALSGTTALGSTSKSLSLTGSQFMADVQQVGTVTEVVTTGELAELRYAYLQNSSTSATVTVSTAPSVLQPGDVMLFPPGSALVTLQATADATDVHKVLTEA